MINQEDAMNKEQMHGINTDMGTENRQTMRPWITPAFERERLEEALSSSPKITFKFDGPFTYIS